jgi:hypothetical protein
VETAQDGDQQMSCGTPQAERNLEPLQGRFFPEDIPHDVIDDFHPRDIHGCFFISFIGYKRGEVKTAGVTLNGDTEGKEGQSPSGTVPLHQSLFTGD